MIGSGGRPAALEGLDEGFGDLGFAARRVVPLESSHVASLAAKFADRRRLSAAKAAQLAAQVARREYRGLAEVRWDTAVCVGPRAFVTLGSLLEGRNRNRMNRLASAVV